MPSIRTPSPSHQAPPSLHRTHSGPRATYPGSRLHAGRPSAGTSLPGAAAAVGAGSQRAASPHSPSLLAPGPAMHWRCPAGQAERGALHHGSPIIQMGTESPRGCGQGQGSPSPHRLAHRDQLALRRHEGRPVAQPQLGLQRVEVNLQLALLLHAGWLVQAPVVPEVLQLALHGAHAGLTHAVLQPRHSPADPFQQLRGTGRGRAQRAERACSPCLPVSSHAQAVANRPGLERGGGGGGGGPH